MDIVQILTTKNARYVIIPDGKAKPQGWWMVLAILSETDVLIGRDGVTCRIPVVDVETIGRYDALELYKQIEGRHNEQETAGTDGSEGYQTAAGDGRVE